MLTPREKSPLPEKKKILHRGSSNLRRCTKQDSEPNTLTELFQPHAGIYPCFSRSSQTCEATMPGDGHYRVNARTGWPAVGSV